MKGVILAGGKGTRLLPATAVTNKHMVPLLNTPMILYPLETLKALGISDILIISGGNHLGSFADFLGDGSSFGVSLTYRVQKEAGGIAEALGLARDFAKGSTRIAAILGDNVFDNAWFAAQRDEITKSNATHAHLFVKEVAHPERFGVFTEIKGKGHIEEKPTHPNSARAVTGLYIYPVDVFDVIDTLQPSARGEREITDVNNVYLDSGRAHVATLPGFWSDAGTPESLYEATVWAYEQRRP